MHPSPQRDTSDTIVLVLVGICLAILLAVAAVRTAGASEPDYDADGIPNAEDNCPCTYNPDQTNLEWIGGVGLREDYDPHGNACDGDWAGAGGLGSHQDELVGLPDFNVFVYCLNNGNTGDPSFPVSTVCLGSDMDSSGEIGIPDYGYFVTQLQRSFPGELAAECAP